MARVYSIPRGPVTDAAGEMRPEWRAYFQKMSNGLAAAAAVTALDGGTTYTADQLRDKIIELQTALGADV